MHAQHLSVDQCLNTKETQQAEEDIKIKCRTWIFAELQRQLERRGLMQVL
jgi:hypothetical protein